MAEEDIVNNSDHFTNDRTVLEDEREHIDTHNGETMLSMPDNTNAIVTLGQAAEMVRQAVNNERKQYADINKGVLRVNTNKSGGIQFRTYQITSAMGAILIVKEKENRGNTVITNFGDQPIFIGAHPGLVANGSDTVQIVGETSRTIRTRSQLYAVTDSATAVQFDVQEEFD